MPKFDSKIIHQELQDGWLWPVYWIHGPETMKAREIVKRIQTAFLGQNPGSDAQPEIFDGARITAEDLLADAQSFGLFGGAAHRRFLIIRDAHLLKDPDTLLESLFGARARRDQVDRVAVFVSTKDLDGRRKATKTLLSQAAVIPCEEIAEHEREAWVRYLLKRRQMGQPPVSEMMRLRALDPWTLDIVDQELERASLEGSSSDIGAAPALSGGGPIRGEKADFVDAFFSKRKGDALLAAREFAGHADEALPMLGLLAWNARYLALLVRGGGGGGRPHAGGPVPAVSVSPQILERMRRWARSWTPMEVENLQTALARVDFGTKQTARSAQGLWTELVLTTMGS